MRSRLFGSVVILALLLVSGSCSNSNFPNVSLLGSLRILSLQLNTPEVSPGASVTLTPLISDLNGAGRALTYTIDTCADFGIDLGATPSCDSRPDLVVVANNQPLTGLTAPTYTGTGPTASITVPTNILDSYGTVDQYNGVSYLVIYKVFSGTTELARGLKRIVASTKTPKNNNPALLGIQSNGTALSTTLPPTVVTLLPNLSPGSAETYTQMFSDGTSTTQQETLLTSWYISDGTLSDSVTAVTQGDTWTPPAAAPSTRPVLLIAVTRDQRGGENTAVLQLQ